MVSIENFGVSYARTNLADRAKARRLALNLSRKTLAERACVAASNIKRFELTGAISIENLLKIALVLECLGDFDNLFQPSQAFHSLDEFSKPERKRGRE